MASISLSGITVSPNEFLVFASVEDCLNYKIFLGTHSWDEIQDYHQQLGFQCLAGSAFDPIDPMHLNEKEQTELMFDQNFTLQVGSILIKPIDNYQFILTMDQNNMSSASFNNFKNGSFDITVMNKLSGLSFPSEHNSLFDFAGYSQYGNEDIDPNTQPPVETMSWFWKHTHKEEIIGGDMRIKRVIDDYYLFRIHIVHSVTYPARIVML